MTTYTRLDVPLPEYQDGNGSNLEMGTEPRQPIPSPVYSNRISCCCIVVSVLNFIFCSMLGIPSLIFTILGIEADKKRDFKTADRHRHYMYIFNIVGCILVWPALLAQTLQYSVYSLYMATSQYYL